MAWYLHFKYLAEQHAGRNEKLVIVVADIQTRAKKHQLRSALQDVTDQFPAMHSELVVWSAESSWGLQMADYGTWSAQRILNGRKCDFWSNYMKALTHSFYKPWG
jgi:hypothetical protein